MKQPPPAIICIGRNYADHATEMGGEAPTSPTVFMKNPASVIDDGDQIVIPSICEHMDRKSTTRANWPSFWGMT